MVSPYQSQVAERPFDLIGTLADTCKAKKVLNWQARYIMREEMPKLLQTGHEQVATADSDGKSIGSRNKAAKDHFSQLHKNSLSIFGSNSVAAKAFN